MAGGAQPAVEPCRIRCARADGGAGLAFEEESLHHRRADSVDAVDRHGVAIVIGRVAERRAEQHRTRRAGLVVVVNDLRQPLAIHHAVHVLGFGLGVGVKVAVVVVADVFLVQPGQLAGPALRRNLGAIHVVVGAEVIAVGIGVDEEDDDVVEDAQRLRIIGRDVLVKGLGEHLGAEHFGGVEAAVDPNHGLAFRSQLGRRGLAEALGQRHAAGDALIMGQLGVIGGRGDNAHHLLAAFLGEADLEDLEPIGLGLDLVPVAEHLLVIRQAIVVSQVEAEMLLGRGDRLSLGGGLGQRPWG